MHLLHITQPVFGYIILYILHFCSLTCWLASSLYFILLLWVHRYASLHTAVSRKTVKLMAVMCIMSPMCLHI